MITFQKDSQLRDILTQYRSIAVVGHSPKAHRPSYQIAQFLRQKGYEVHAVNPGHTDINGYPCYPSLDHIPSSVDVVNVFRRSEYLPAIVAEAISIQAKVLWTQLDIVHEVAAQKAIDAGLIVVMNRCIKIEYLRLDITAS